MPLYQIQCSKHGETEIFAGINDMVVPCETCGKPTKRLISVSGINCANQDADWIRSCLEVVCKDSTASHVVAFRKNPNRATLKAWMKGQGLRHMEKGEENIKREEIDLTRVHEEVWLKHRARHALEIRG